jgi:signal peptidase I
LISDFLAYNTGSPVLAYNSGAPGFVPHWVGDLALQCNLEIQSAAGAAIVELVKGGRRFQCRFDVASGAAVLAVNGRDMEQFHPQAATAVRGPGTHEIIFCNVDDQLRLFVNGREVRFDSPTTYDSDSLGTHQPRQADLSPLGIATQGAALTVRHLRILRDIYYLADESREDESRAHPIQDFVRYVPDLSDPSTWPQAFREDNLNQVEFTLAEPNPRNPDKDQFFVCGDNSAQSKDSRLWDSYVTIDGRQRREYWVSRELLIGKALLIYWPHSFDRIPGTHIPFPFFPNFQRMQLVR